MNGEGQELRYAPPVGAMLGQSPKDAPVAHTALGDLLVSSFRASPAQNCCDLTYLLRHSVVQ